MFRDVLQNILDQTPGARSVILMGCDGIAVDAHYRDAVPAEETQGVAVEFATVIKELIHTANLLSVGALEEVTVKCDKLVIVLTMLNEDYFVALLFDESGNVGKGRYLLKRDAQALRDALD